MYNKLTKGDLDLPKGRRVLKNRQPIRGSRLKQKMKRQVLTKEELKELLSADLTDVRQQNRRWFWARTAFCLAYIIAMVVALTFFPDRIFAKFNLPEESASIITGSYVQLRLLVIAIATFIYLASYYFDRYFQFVSFAAVLIAIGNLVNDYFTVYVYTKPENLIPILVISMFRIMMIVFLYANFRYSLKADVRFRD